MGGRIELVRGKVTRVEKKHGERGVYFDVTHKFGEPFDEGWFLNIPLTANFEEGQEVVVYLEEVDEPPSINSG